MQTLAIVQARMGSSRLPGKVMKEILGRPMIDLLLNRLSKSNKLNGIIIATTEEQKDQALAEFIELLGFKVFKGSEDDVLERFYEAARIFKPKNIVRITGDCPLIDPIIIDGLIDHFISKDIDYASNIWPRTFPTGLDAKIFTFEALERTINETSSSYNREHVTPYLRESGKFKVSNFSNKTDYSELRWTVDWSEDFTLIKNIFEYFHPRSNFSWREVIKLSRDVPELFQVNSHLVGK